MYYNGTTENPFGPDVNATFTQNLLINIPLLKMAYFPSERSSEDSPVVSFNARQ